MNKKAKELLKKNQWGRSGFCPVCKNYNKIDKVHKDTCWLNQALALEEQPCDIQQRIGKWADKQFPQSTNNSIFKHLAKEVKELSKSSSSEEAADCLMILLHFAHRNGFDIYAESLRKLEINKTRKWGKPDKDGVVEHIKEQPCQKCGGSGKSLVYAKSCPECGCEEIVNENLLGEGSRQCKKCLQDWWLDVKYAIGDDPCPDCQPKPESGELVKRIRSNIKAYSMTFDSLKIRKAISAAINLDLNEAADRIEHLTKRASYYENEVCKNQECEIRVLKQQIEHLESSEKQARGVGFKWQQIAQERLEKVDQLTTEREKEQLDNEDAIMLECWLVHPKDDEDCLNCPSIKDCREVREEVDRLVGENAAMKQRAVSAEEDWQKAEAEKDELRDALLLRFNKACENIMKSLFPKLLADLAAKDKRIAELELATDLTIYTKEQLQENEKLKERIAECPNCGQIFATTVL